MIRYRSRTGEYRLGDVWSPGPEPNTIWVLDSTAGAVVVAVYGNREPHEVPWIVPGFPEPVTIAKADKDRAISILKAERAWNSWKAYGHHFQDSPEPSRPESGELEWAQRVAEEFDHQIELWDYYRECHFAPASVGPVKFRQLANRDDERCMAA